MPKPNAPLLWAIMVEQLKLGVGHRSRQPRPSDPVLAEVCVHVICRAVFVRGVVHWRRPRA